MTAEQNRILVRGYYEEFWGRADVSRLETFCAPTFHFRLGRIADLPSLPAFMQFISMLFASFPDFTCSVLEPMLAEGDRVVTRYAWTGTHAAASAAIFNRFPPTGKKVRVTGMTIDRVADGRIVEEWCEEDLMGLAQQLGVVPR